MNKKGYEWGKLVSGILAVAVLVIIVVALYTYFRPTAAEAGEFGKKATSALKDLGIDIFKKSPSDLSQMTNKDIERQTAEERMNTLFQEGNSFSSGIENFDIKQCSQDFINKLDTAYKKYEEYVKNCNDPKSQYYQGCKQTSAENYKIESEKKMAAIKVIKDRCAPIISTQKDLLGSLSEDVKRLKEDAITYEKLGNYKKAIEILEEYIKKLKVLGEDKNKDLINEAYVKINENYRKIILDDIVKDKQENYLDAWNIFNKKGNENIKVLMPNEYKTIVLELAEPIDCKNALNEGCIVYDKIPFLTLKYGLGEVSDIRLSKEDIKNYPQFGCYKKDDSTCLSCLTIHQCGNYNQASSKKYREEACLTDPCSLAKGEKCIFKTNTIVGIPTSYECNG